MYILITYSIKREHRFFLSKGERDDIVSAVNNGNKIIYLPRYDAVINITGGADILIACSKDSPPKHLLYSKDWLKYQMEIAAKNCVGEELTLRVQQLTEIEDRLYKSNKITNKLLPTPK